MAALRPLKRLRSLTLAGNPAAAGPGARSWAIAHLPSLHFLDHAHVSPADVAAAREQFQARPVHDQKAPECDAGLISTFLSF